MLVMFRWKMQNFSWNRSESYSVSARYVSVCTCVYPNASGWVLSSRVYQTLLQMDCNQFDDKHCSIVHTKVFHVGATGKFDRYWGYCERVREIQLKPQRLVSLPRIKNNSIWVYKNSYLNLQLAKLHTSLTGFSLFSHLFRLSFFPITFSRVTFTTSFLRLFFFRGLFVRCVVLFHLIPMNAKY